MLEDRITAANASKFKICDENLKMVGCWLRRTHSKTRRFENAKFYILRTYGKKVISAWKRLDCTRTYSILTLPKTTHLLAYLLVDMPCLGGVGDSFPSGCGNGTDPRLQKAHHCKRATNNGHQTRAIVVPVPRYSLIFHGNRRQVDNELGLWCHIFIIGCQLTALQNLKAIAIGRNEFDVVVKRLVKISRDVNVAIHGRCRLVKLGRKWSSFLVLLVVDIHWFK